MDKLIKSKKRVKERGEVFTPEHIVKDMCDKVEPCMEDIHKRIFEPACGTGNYLVEILKRRLSNCNCAIEKMEAVANLYGVDIAEDNVLECRERLYKMVDEDSEDIKRIIDGNIIVGDTINHPEKIEFTFYEFKTINGVTNIYTQKTTLSKMLEGG